MDSSSSSSSISSTAAKKSFPECIQHSFQLDDGRTFSYYTFATATTTATASSNNTTETDDKDNDDNDQKKKNEEEEKEEELLLHPVLYIHGFPGCGREGALCARELSQQGCQIYAIDRPGFGDTQIMANYDDDGMNEDQKMDATIQDIWEFVTYMKWTSFSVIGVSGGGPYTLALLASYLANSVKKDSSPPPSPNNKKAKIESICLVAGVCCSAGIDNMMPKNQDLYKAVGKAKTSWFSNGMLRFTFAVSSYAVSYLPTWIMSKGMKSTSQQDLPEVDMECFLANDEMVLNFMLRILPHSLKQGGTGAYEEARILFRNDKPKYETVLKSYFSSDSGRGRDATAAGGAAAANIDIPRIAIYHGTADKNVPISHSEYVREELFCNNNKDHVHFVQYEDMGHLSLVVQKANDYAQFVAASSPAAS